MNVTVSEAFVNSDGTVRMSVSAMSVSATSVSKAAVSKAAA